MNNTYIHLLLNHFPIVGTLVGSGIFFWGIIKRQAQTQSIAAGILLVMAIIAIPVYLTGEPAEETVENLPGVSESMMELHEEGKELTSENVAKKANETDDEVETLSAEKVGRMTKRLGFAKERTGKSRQRLICWDAGRITKLIGSYGLQMALPLSMEKPSEPSLLSALATNQADSSKEGSVYCPPYCPPKTEADSSVGADSRTERTVTDKELTKEASAGE